MNFKALLLVVVVLCLQIVTVSAFDPIVENADAVWISNAGYEEAIDTTTTVSGTDVIVSLGHLSEDETVIVHASSGAWLPWGFQIRKGEELILVNDWWDQGEHETKIPGYAYGAGDYYLVLTTGGVGVGIDIKPYFEGFEDIIPGASIAYIAIGMPSTEWNVSIDKISTPAPEKIEEDFSGCNVLLYIGCFSSSDASVTVKADSGAWSGWKMQVWEVSMEEANVTDEWHGWWTHETEIEGPGNYYLHLSTGNLTLETSLSIPITVKGFPVAVVSINPDMTIGLPPTAWKVTMEYSLSETKDILVKDANAIWRSSLNTTPTKLNDSAGTTLPRPLVEYPNTAFGFELNECPEELANNACKVLPRPLIEYPNTASSKSLIFPKELMNDTTSPIITNVTAENMTDNSATIEWDTDKFANSLVKYGTSSGVYTKQEFDELYIKNHSVTVCNLSPETGYYFVVNSTDQSGNLNESIEYDFNTTGELKVFDTGAPENSYPSIMGTHNGTIKPNQTIPVSRLYTSPCKGTGGHSEYIKIWKDSDWNVTAGWVGYSGDWHNISFGNSFTLEEGETYYYTIHTGSYPQIHHTDNLSTPTGFITCSEFIDANGKRYNDWIPAIRLELE